LAEVNSLFSLEEPVKARHRFSLRRSHLEIRMDILSCIKSGFDKPTQVMYKANLSWISLKEHLVALEGGSLIRTVEYGSRRKYELTEKAFAVLASYDKILSEISAPLRKADPVF
jgi:predicted transcriptional regulator